MFNLLVQLRLQRTSDRVDDAAGTAIAANAIAADHVPGRPARRCQGQDRDDRKARSLSVTIVPPAKRREDNDVRAQIAGGGSPFGGPQAPPQTPKDILTANQINEQLDQFLAPPAHPAGSTTPAAITGRFAPSTTGPSTLRSRCRRW